MCWRVLIALQSWAARRVEFYIQISNLALLFRKGGYARTENKIPPFGESSFEPAQNEGLGAKAKNLAFLPFEARSP
jgi:hypothetical protein